jgi:hypothetical protein
MVVIALLVLGAAVLAGWVLLVALVGRSSFPRRERLPLRSWRFADLRANAARGLAELGSFADAPLPTGPRRH